MVARRYAPFAIIVAAMLLLVIVAPSKAPAAVAGTQPFDSSVGGGFQGATAAPDVSPGATAAAGGAQASSAPAGAAAGAPGSGGATARGGGPAGGQAGGAPLSLAAAPPGDTSHCVNGRQFGDLVTAPPCTPKFGGNNGGATYQGVTDKTIVVDYYRESDSPAVQAIEKPQGIYSDPTLQKDFLAAAQTFVNSRYELYGRKVQFNFYQGACNASPPNPSCYRTDVDTMNSRDHPFAVIYDDNSNAPDFFDELSRLGVVNLGGWHFNDAFDQQLRPYHYDVFTTGDYQAEITGEWWCKRLAGKPAKFAGDAALQGKTRMVGIIAQNASVNVSSAEHLKAIINQCAPNSAEVKTYSSDTATATSQSTSLVTQFKNDGVTSVLFFCDPIAPVYLTKQESNQNWFPEQVLAGSGLLDYDPLAQLYDQSEWKHAFGPSDSPNAEPISKQDPAIVWRAAGQSGDPYCCANLMWGYLSVLASGLDVTGPNLNPTTFEHALLVTLPPTPGTYDQTHDPYHQYAKYGPNPSALGAYGAVRDERDVYYDGTATSPINGKAGAYIPLNGGRRYTMGQWPSSDEQYPAGV